MKKDSSKLNQQKFTDQQLNQTQTSQIKGGNGNSTDIIITDAVIL